MPKNEKKKIIIIGAGISGISAGIYAEKNGFISEIYEKNPTPGGLCVNWKRDGMEIDGCVHWLTGTKEGTQLYDMWRDVDAFDDDTIIQEDHFGVIDYEGERLVLYCDLKKFEEELIEISPEDTKEIKKLIKNIIRIQNMPLPTHIPLKLMSFAELMKIGFGLIPYLYVYFSTNKISTVEYSKRFHSPLIRYALTHVIPGDNNLYSVLFAYGTCCVGNGGVPKGGSYGMTKRMVNKYLDLGGFINYCSPVKDIIIEKNKAKGIRLENGKEIYADYVISACDSFETINKLLKDEYIDKDFEMRFKNGSVYKVPSCVYVSYRANMEAIKNEGIDRTFLFATAPFRVGNSFADEIKIREYSQDPTFIDGDDTLITVLIHQNNRDFPFWNNIRQNYKSYKAEKDRLADVVTKAIIERFPSLEGKIKAIDVATPMTYARYVNAYKGGYMPFSITPKAVMLMHKGYISGLHNFYLAGQWTQMPGGLPIALISGKFAVQRILKKEKKFFHLTAAKFVNYK